MKLWMLAFNITILISPLAPLYCIWSLVQLWCISLYMFNLIFLISPTIVYVFFLHRILFYKLLSFHVDTNETQRCAAGKCPILRFRFYDKFGQEFNKNHPFSNSNIRKKCFETRIKPFDRHKVRVVVLHLFISNYADIYFLL